MKLSPPLHRFLRLAWVVAVAVVIIATLLPDSSLPIRELASLNINDKIEHFCAYAVLALLPSVHESRRFLFASVFALIGLGIILEYGQLATGRDFEIGDMVADTAGVLVGVAAGLTLRRRSLLEG